MQVANIQFREWWSRHEATFTNSLDSMKKEWIKILILGILKILIMGALTTWLVLYAIKLIF